MSRRKQAKPRAFLKLGDDCEDDPLSATMTTKEEVFSDNEDQSQHGDEEDENVLETIVKCSHVEQENQQQTTKALQITAATATATSGAVRNGDTNNSNGDSHAAAFVASSTVVSESRQTTNVESSSCDSQVANVVTLHATKVQQQLENAAPPPKSYNKSEDVEHSNRGGDGVDDDDDIDDVQQHKHSVALPILPTANHIDIGSTSTGNIILLHNGAVESATDGGVEKHMASVDFKEDDVDDDEDDDIDDYDDDDEDLLSLDSYYSDMYSTHTSSSYSPSISDGTITPNSLHQQHLPAHHLQHLQNLQQMHDDATIEAERHLNGDNIDETEEAANEETSHGGGGVGSDDSQTKKRQTAKNTTENVAALEQLKRHGRHQRQHHHHNHLHHHHGLNVVHGLKMPTKLRKIERDSAGGGGGNAAAAGKLDKLTGEGIRQKNGTGGGNGNGNNAADGSYQCQFCDKSFPRLGYLKKHEQSHAEHLPFKCDYCARLFKHKRSRDRHTKLHTGDRRYRCPHCEAAFSRSDHLKIHMKTHDNQKPFQCTICNRGYNTAAALTSHMQNHKKQAAILAAGGNPQAFNYSPRSTGSASSNGSLHKRRYGLAASIASDSSPSHLDFPSKRLRPSYMNCSYCGKSDFNTIEQLNTHMQATHEKELAQIAASSGGVTTTPIPPEPPAFQLSCEYCTMKLPNIPALFQHMRTTHVDRLSSPNSYFEHFNRLAAAGTFSPRLVGHINKQQQQQQETDAELMSSNMQIKIEDTTSNFSPKSVENNHKIQQQHQQEEEPTDLSAKRRSITPSVSPQTTTSNHATPHSSPTQQQEKQQPQPPPPGVFFCNQCNAGLPDFDSFRNHLKTHITQGLSMMCHHCGLTLRDHAEYERHVISHFLITNSEYNCAGNCNKSYNKPEELQKHLMDQHVVTMYKCAICAEIFESKVSIQVHFACAHAAETKLLRCSACMEVFRAENDFNLHVKTRHHQQHPATTNGNGSLMPGGGGNTLQCMFCRAICGSELEMHFHLAAHARQFRCPSCPETFHVEFLLDRHMQSQHSGNEQQQQQQKNHAPPTLTNKDTSYDEIHISAAAPVTPHTTNHNISMSPMNSLYVNALFGKAAVAAAGGPLLPLSAANAAAQNNNNSILDYNVAFAAAQLKNGLFPTAAAAAASKFYSPLQVDTNAIKHHPALMYGLSQRYFDTNRTLLDMYAQQQQEKAAAGSFHSFISPKQLTTASTGVAGNTPQDIRNSNEILQPQPPPQQSTTANAGFSCGICERNDFRTEAEVHSHRKIVHNMKTGVSLRCAYCSGNFKSRSELEHHMKTCHNSTGKHKCLICDEIFPSPAILAEHKLQHSKVGQSGRCSHCAKPLNDVAAFKEHLSAHNTVGQMPVQCICCRQSLHSEFEIGLHAKFHTKSSSMPESVCALCLEPMPNTTTTEAKVCEKCCRKHNLNAKYHHQQHNQQQQQQQHQQQQQQHHHQHQKSRDFEERHVGPTAAQLSNARQYIENRCNLCKVILPHAQKLQEHLVEHTFAGCEERGFNCYICSAVFTAPAGLLQHMHEHGANSRPYDCNLCTDKFFFRAELDHHLVDHELRVVVKMQQQEVDKTSKLRALRSNSLEKREERLKEQKAPTITATTPPPLPPPRPPPPPEPATMPTATSLTQAQVKQEVLDEEADDTKSNANAAEDDEYIEVEQVVAEQQTVGERVERAGVNDSVEIEKQENEERNNKNAT